jgi:hypothetical protein
MILQVSGKVDQSGAMLSDDVEEKGYALLCMAMPQTDCEIMTVSEASGWSQLQELCSFCLGPVHTAGAPHCCWLALTLCGSRAR